jgi:hypothetical protein
MHIASIGIDLGKTTFHLVALGERNKHSPGVSAMPHRVACGSALRTGGSFPCPLPAGGAVVNSRFILVTRGSPISEDLEEASFSCWGNIGSESSYSFLSQEVSD